MRICCGPFGSCWGMQKVLGANSRLLHLAWGDPNLCPAHCTLTVADDEELVGSGGCGVGGSLLFLFRFLRFLRDLDLPHLRPRPRPALWSLSGVLPPDEPSAPRCSEPPAPLLVVGFALFAVEWSSAPVCDDARPFVLTCHVGAEAMLVQRTVAHGV